jgi:penicillin-binding protein 1A
VWRGIKGAALAVVVLAVLGGGGAGYVLYTRVSAGLPDVNGLRNYQPPVMSRVYAGDGRLLAELATERRVFVPISAVPALVKNAFLAAEDQNFYTHGGIDPLAIARAAVTDMLRYGDGRRPVGASTITQQVAKNMLLGNEMTLSRKLREALLAVRIERTLSKDRILELYLNEIYLGAGAYGVAAAAQAYFDKPLDALTPAEAAFLAALPKAPNNYQPQRFPDAAKARRDWVLDRMVDTHAITAEQAAAAKASPLIPALGRRPDMVTGADYFAEEVRRRLLEKFPDALTGGYAVRTSLDPRMQAEADRALRDGLVRYDEKHGGWRGPVDQLGATAASRDAWPTALAGVTPPPGMPPNWRLAIVTAISGGAAWMGLLEPATPGRPPTGRVVPMTLADAGWARPLRDGNLGPAPRRIDDVVHPGDVVMVELSPATAGKGARPEQALLRQIPAVEGALVTIEPRTGRVLAMSGGWSFEMSQFNRATQAQRQPGSSFKPLVYLTALEQGISPSQIFLDAPFVKDMGPAGEWRPGNYELDFNGPVPLHVALEKSLNLVTVRVADRIGMDAVANTAIAFHEVDSMPRVLPAALGAVDTTVLREAGAYAGFAAGGRAVEPTLIDTVQDRDGHLIWAAPGVTCQGCDDPARPPTLVDARKQVADPDSTFQLIEMMQGVVTRGTGTAAGAGLGRQIAGKTGTTQDFNDAWFVGFTPDLVTAVWVGYDTPASLGENETGGAIAAPIWHDYMANALRGRPNLKFVPPPDLTIASYDSGFGTVTDAFKPGQVPGASVPDAATAGATGDSAGGGIASGASAPAPAAAGVDAGMGGLY